MDSADLALSRRVPTVDGDKTLVIRQGAQTADRLRMRGYGAPLVGSRGRGDQYVHLKCDPPAPIPAPPSPWHQNDSAVNCTSCKLGPIPMKGVLDLKVREWIFVHVS